MTQIIVRLLSKLIVLTVLTVGMVNMGYSRGYGSGNGEGQNYTDYLDMTWAERRFFARYDSDCNGFLNKAEALEMGISEELFEQSDIDRNGRLNRAEFIRIRVIAHYQ